MQRRHCFSAEEEGVMDPITAAILAVLPALASDVVKSGVKDAYEGLKAVIRRKWGDAALIIKAIAAIEEDPTSKAQAAVLEEKVGAVP
jgi:disulfide oxidoreductase YuzD